MRLEHALIASALLAAGPARGGPSISLDGVPIDGATLRRIENARVRIGERGNIDILRGRRPSAR